MHEIPDLGAPKESGGVRRMVRYDQLTSYLLGPVRGKVRALLAAAASVAARSAIALKTPRSRVCLRPVSLSVRDEPPSDARPLSLAQTNTVVPLAVPALDVRRHRDPLHRRRRPGPARCVGRGGLEGELFRAEEV